jgi:two-component system, OmpR family, response regulator MprA
MTEFLKEPGRSQRTPKSLLNREVASVPRVLLVDDDKKLLPLLERGFRYEGFEVLAAATSADGLNLARTRTPDVVVLDIGLPVVDGFEVCRHLRRHADIPIIMLTARDEVADKVSALNLGADDYVTKPFAFDELVARVRALLRRRAPSQAGRLAFEDLTCDVSTREVYRAGRPIPLTAREFDLLACFLRHPRQVLVREALLEKVWGYEFSGDTKVVDVYVGYLRQKLGEPRLVQTVRGVGYALRTSE